MPCYSVSGLTSVCDNGAAAGIRGLRIGAFDYNTTWSANTLGYIVTGSSLPTMYRVTVAEENSSLTEEMVVNAKVRNYSWRSTFELVIVGQSQSAITWVNQVASAGMVLAVETEQGSIKLLGRVKPVRISAGSANVGVAAGDENTIKLSFSVVGQELTPEIGTAFAATWLV